MATDVMLQLGEFQFSVDTAAYQTLKRKTTYRWESQTRVGQRDSLQFTGRHQDTINLDGAIYPAHRGGIGQLDAMRAEADRGEPLRLVDGLGEIHGLWVILDVEEDQDTFLPGGIPRRQKFKLKLKQYDDELSNARG